MTTTALTDALHRDAAETWLAAIGTVRCPAALRDVPPAVRSGRLIDVLEPAVDMFEQTVAVPADVVLQLRVLVDALTAMP